jgi:hypothetical protein
MNEDRTITKGWCTNCYAGVYRRSVLVDVPKDIERLTEEDLAAPLYPMSQTHVYLYSLQPHGPTIQYCPFCGTMF